MPVHWQVARNIMHKQTQTFVMFWHYLYNPYVKICLIKRRCLQIDVIQYTSKKIYHKKISWFCFSWFFSVPWWKSSPPAETFSCMRFIENQLATICKSKMQSTTQFLLFKCDNPLLIHAFFHFVLDSWSHRTKYIYRHHYILFPTKWLINLLRN